MQGNMSEPCGSCFNRIKPDDYVIATGEQHSVQECLEVAFSYLGLDYREFVAVDENFFRPAEVETLLGDASKAREKLGWSCEVKIPGINRGNG